MKRLIIAIIASTLLSSCLNDSDDYVVLQDDPVIAEFLPNLSDLNLFIGNQQDLVLNVTLAYLQVLNSKAVLDLTQQRYEATKKQLKIQKDLLQFGIVGLHDAGVNQTELSRFKEMEKSGDLKISIYPMLSNNEENIQYLIEKGKTQTDRINVQSIKCFADGALGSRGACMKENYRDSDTKGSILIEEDALNALAKFCIDNDMQLNTHCIGDSSFSWVVKTYAKYLEKGNDRRWRIEHAQVIDPLDLKIMKEYNIIPSVQPCHALSDMNWVQDRIGERDTFAYNYRLLKNNANFIISGTDFPLESPNPFANFLAGTKRQFLDLTPANGYKRNAALSKMEMLTVKKN